MGNTCNKWQTPENGKLGCGLRYLVPFIKEHYADEKKTKRKGTISCQHDWLVIKPFLWHDMGIIGLMVWSVVMSLLLSTWGLWPWDGLHFIYNKLAILFNKASTNNAELVELKVLSTKMAQRASTWAFLSCTAVRTTLLLYFFSQAMLMLPLGRLHMQSHIMHWNSMTSTSQVRSSNRSKSADESGNVSGSLCMQSTVCT